MTESWSGDFYCVKCKQNREADGEVVVDEHGTRTATAVCHTCGTQLDRVLGQS